MIFSIKAKSPTGIKAQIGTQRNKGKPQLECIFSTAVYVPALGLLRFVFILYLRITENSSITKFYIHVSKPEPSCK